MSTKSETMIGPSLEDAVATNIATPVVDASRRERIWERIRGQIDELHVVRAADGEWRELLPGVTIKRLHIDSAGVETALWRLSAGAFIPPHPHARDEECLVLEGSIVDGEQVFFAGDYVLARAGSRHQRVYAPNGALLMIRSELH
jgi:anti-sigma factor ChrR (cupin superfamily)